MYFIKLLFYVWCFSPWLINAVDPEKMKPVQADRVDVLNDSSKVGDVKNDRSEAQDFDVQGARPVKKRSKMILFDFENEELSTVVNRYAAFRKMNIILPYGANAMQQRVTLRLRKKISLDEAERYLDSILDIAGYLLVPHGDAFMIVKNDPQAAREPLPLFINVKPSELPDVGRIQVIYYLQNIRVPESSQGTDPLNVVLNDTLTPQRSYVFDTKSNAIIISDRAVNIKATMSMILELDAVGVRDIIKSVQLFNTSAATVAALLQSQVIAVSGTLQGKLRSESKVEAGLFFDPSTKIVADTRTNSIIIMGKEPSVERIIDFVREYIDVPLESGRSILHYAELQYLDSEQFAEVLKKIVAQGMQSGQATQDSGTSRSFEGVIIIPEKLVEEVITQTKLAESKYFKDTESILKGTVYRGGNRIIVAAKERDWQRIKKLIHDLDKPQLQVIVQVLIIDFDVQESKVLGAQTRNPSLLNLPPGVNFQTTHLVAPPIPFSQSGTNVPTTTLAADLLSLISASPAMSAAAKLVNNSNQGSTIISFNDPNGSGIWSFLQWLNTFGETKILSHPYLVALNNHKAEEVISTIRRLAGDATTGEGGLLASKQQEIEAALRISVVPRASSSHRVNLQISLAINDFVTGAQSVAQTSSSTPNNLITREMHTDVNMGSGQMLVIGGLGRTGESDTDRETPLLGRIPILRWLFSESERSERRTNITVLVIPTVIEPKLRAGMIRYTRDKIENAHDALDEGSLFDKMRDPVTYLFFRGQNISNVMLEEYLADSNGDFVWNKSRTNSAEEGQSVSPEQTKRVITQESQEVKRMLAAEGNPLLFPVGGVSK